MLPVFVVFEDVFVIVHGVPGRGEVAVGADAAVAVELDEEDPLAGGIAALAEHRDARDEAVTLRLVCDLFV